MPFRFPLTGRMVNLLITMAQKIKAYVKKQTDQNEINSGNVSNCSLTINEQLEKFAQLLVEIYINQYYENEKGQ